MKKKIRTFLALDLPERIREQIGRIAFGLPSVRWIPTENFHITLRFLGEVSPPALELLQQKLQEMDVSSFPVKDPIHLCSPRILLQKDTRGVLVCPALPVQVVDPVYSGLNRILRELQFPDEKRPFFPHATLARFTSLQRRPLESYVETFQDFQTDSWMPDGLCLYESKLTPEGARYTVLERYRLENPID